MNTPNGSAPESGSNATLDSATQRGSFATNFGFVMAAAGSAVGLGNIWKFPYITGEYGGGAFVIVYLACIAVVGLPLMYAELVIGRRGGKDILGGMRDLAGNSVFGRQLAFLTGCLAVVSGFLILSFYSVVAGWAIHFLFISAGDLVDSLLGSNSPSLLGVDGIFGSVAGNAGLSSMWHSIFMLCTVGVVMFGIRGGIEGLCKKLMPALVLMLLGMLVYVARTGGLAESAAFLFTPDFSKLTPDAVLEALGHAFFTLSLGMGAMVTYGSYLKSERRIVTDGVIIAGLDTGIALLAGLVIFSVVFAGGLEPSAGPGLIFETLPSLFIDMTGGMIVATAFFLLVFFAAWSSAVSLLEVVVAYFVDERKWSRPQATWVMGGAAWALGLACARSGEILDMLDNLTTRYCLPLGGLAIAIAAGWILTKQDRESGFAAIGKSGEFLAPLWTWTIRIVTPVLVILVLLSKAELIDFSGLW